MVTSVVITVITTDADGNTSAATRTVDLLGSSTSQPAGTTSPLPRQFRVLVRDEEIRVVGDRDSLGGQGDFIIAGQLDAGSPDSFSFGTRSNTVQLGDGATLDLSGEQSSSRATDEGTPVDWSVSFVVSEVDVGGNDPNMNSRTVAHTGVISAARGPRSRSISVGSGSCRVDMSFTVIAELQ